MKKDSRLRLAPRKEIVWLKEFSPKENTWGYTCFLGKVAQIPSAYLSKSWGVRLAGSATQPEGTALASLGSGKEKGREWGGRMHLGVLCEEDRDVQPRQMLGPEDGGSRDFLTVC